jgi:hypothetical protein
MSIVSDTIATTSAAIGFGIVIVGGVYYLLPGFNGLPDQSTVEDKVSQYAIAPINIAGGIGSKLGKNIMNAAGYTYTAYELEQLRPKLFGQANVWGTPENAAQILHEIMLQRGQIQQLNKARVDLIGTSKSDWNIAVANAYYPMYSQKLEVAILSYISKQIVEK